VVELDVNHCRGGNGDDRAFCSVLEYVFPDHVYGSERSLILHERRADLTTLCLAKAWIGTLTYDDSLRFEHLERLVIDKCQTFGGGEGGGGDIRNYLSLTHMPRLTHLALKLSQGFAPAESFVRAPIFANITTLALSFDAHTDKVSLVLNELQHAKKLEHLSLFVMPQDQSILFNHPFPVKLKSLHINHLLFYIFYQVNYDAMGWLDKLMEKKNGKAKVERVVLHASRRPLESARLEWNPTSVEWRGKGMTPFSDFDGR